MIFNYKYYDFNSKYLFTIFAVILLVTADCGAPGILISGDITTILICGLSLGEYPTNEEVIAAAKAASAHTFISKLPDGYETFVGSGGQDLSGGERQRISIARTIIQNPKILILDEATAAMDTETERNIQNSLAELKSGRTTISIAHRLSTLRDADKLAVIDDGECIEFGTYKELMEKQGEYYRLFKLQEEALKFIGIGEEENKNDKENEDGNN